MDDILVVKIDHSCEEQSGSSSSWVQLLRCKSLWTTSSIASYPYIPVFPDHRIKHEE